MTATPPVKHARGWYPPARKFDARGGCMWNLSRRLAVSTAFAVAAAALVLLADRQIVRRLQGATGTPGTAAHAGERGRSRRAPRLGATRQPTPTVDPIADVDAPRPPFDVGAIVRQIHFAYSESEDGSGFVAGDPAYDVAVSRSGDLRVSTRRTGDEVSDSEEEATIFLASARVQRGTARFGGGRAPRDLRVAEDGHLTIDRLDYLEHLRDDERGVEQSWEFVAPLRGSGALRIDIDVEGLTLVATTPTGLHFASRESGLGFRYGHATVVDARGTKTAVEASFSGGAIHLVLDEELLTRATYPIVVDPVISPEIGVDDPLVVGHAANQADPDIAWNGTYFLAVWSDTRNSSSSWDIYGARLTSTGALVDPGGFSIARTSALEDMPSVESNGTDYLVAFQKYNSGTVEHDVLAVRVASDATILDPTPFVVSAGVTEELDPSVASGGTDYLVAWEDNRSGTTTDIYAARVTAAGVVLDPNGILVRATAEDPSAAGNATIYLVSYTDFASTTRDVRASRVTRSTGIVGTSTSVASDATYDEDESEVVSNGTDFLVVFEDETNSTTNLTDISVRRFTSTGAANGSKVRIAGSIEDEEEVQATRIGSDFYVGWLRGGATSGAVYGGRFTNAGVALDGAEGVPVTTSVRNRIALASDGSNVCFLERSTEIVARMITGAGTVVSPTTSLVTTQANPEYEPALASNGTVYFVVFTDQRGTGFPGIYGARISGSGAPLDPAGIAIATSVSTGYDAPTVASNGSDFVVGYLTSTNAPRCKRVSGDGAVLDATAITLASTGIDLAFGSNGTNYLATWSAGGNISGRLLYPNGVLDPTTIAISAATGTQGRPAVSSNGADYLVAWEDNRIATIDVYAARVTGTGTVVDATGIIVSNAAADQTTPAIASNGSDYLVVWADARNGASDIYGSRVTSAGVTTDAVGLAISLGTNAQTVPSTAWNGTDYLVVWADMRNSTSDVFGTRVSPLGVVESANAATLFAGDAATAETDPVLASGAPLEFLLVYERPIATVPFAGASRVRARAISYGSGVGAICNAGTDCDSTFCVDGVCCATACAGGTSDCQACSISAGALDDGTCGVVIPSAQHACRPAAGPCDVAEVCTGAGTSCPPDARRPSSYVCRPAVDSCDFAESCDSFSTQCPGDAVAAADTPCRSAAGACDVAEACDGTTAYCPVDAYLDSGTACRPSGGACDVAEVCSGAEATCPGDAVLPSGTMCRPAADVCDVSESCNGASPLCPVDTFAGNSVQCDVSRGPCDFADFCTGNGPSCPESLAPDASPCDDLKSCTSGDQCVAGACLGTLDATGTVCRASNGVCDVAETCDGVGEQCPADAVLPPSVVCRASTGPCDFAETCNGVSAACPGDVPQPLGTICRLPVGPCDVAETCDGSSSTCPSDAYAAVGVICREANGICDLEETCDGTGPACPANVVKADGTPCDDSLMCTLASECRVGGCAPTLVLDCTDANPCTLDGCAEPYGCTHAVIPACLLDAGGIDSGTNPAPDAGDMRDAGSTGPTPDAGGCSCRAGGASKGPDPSGFTLFAFAIVAFAIVRRKR